MAAAGASAAFHHTQAPVVVQVAMPVAVVASTAAAVEAPAPVQTQAAKAVAMATTSVAHGTGHTRARSAVKPTAVHTAVWLIMGG